MKSRSNSPAFQELPAATNDTSGRRTPNFGGRRTIGPGGFGRQPTEIRSRTPTPSLLDGSRHGSDRNDKQAPAKLECFLPFKLFGGGRSASNPMFEPGEIENDDADEGAEGEIAQMESFISETAASMVAPHCLRCSPHVKGVKDEIFKMETLDDLMKRHKDAFQEEYTEFGPTSVWAPEPPNANSMPIPVAARKLGKFFDLRGELSTINHIRRARCRQRFTPPPVLLERLPTPQQQHVRSATSLGHYEPAREPGSMRNLAPLRKVESAMAYSPPTSARKNFPSSLQALYLPPARHDVNIAEDVIVRD